MLLHVTDTTAGGVLPRQPSSCRAAVQSPLLMMNATQQYQPPKPLLLGSNARPPVASLTPFASAEFNVATYVEDAASKVGLPVDCPQVMQAITILKANGFVSRPLVESLSEKIALDYLKLPIVVWVCLSQAKPTQASVHSPTECLDDVASPQTATARGLAGSKRSTTEAEPAQERKEEPCAHKKARKSSDSGDELAPVTAATVSDRINRYCQEVGHDPAFFQVKSVSSVYCLVCNKTFKLHGRGQITRVKRHVKGEGKKGLSRHMHNLLSVKEKLRTQQIPMLWQIPVHVLQQVQQARLQVAFAGAVPPTLPAAGGSGVHLPQLPMLANIRPATAAARSPLPPSAGLVPPSPTVNTMRSCSPTGGGHLTFPAPLLSQAMAAVPSLQMLQSPSSPLPQPACPSAVTMGPASPSAVARLDESPLHIHGQRQQLDNDTGLVHCHCLSPAKPVLVREPTTTTSTTTTSMASMEGIEIDGGNSDDEDDEDQQQAFRNGRRFYICHRRRSDEGCTFVKPSNEFTRLINDDRLEELDLHDESLQGYVDQNLVEDDDDGGAGAFDDDNGTGAFDSNDDSDDQQFGNHNHHDEDDDDGCGLIIHEDFHHEDGADVGLHMEAGEVESPSTLVMALITDEGDEPSAADTGDAALRHHSEERRLDDEEDESQGSPLEVELNEGGSEGLS